MQCANDILEFEMSQLSTISRSQSPYDQGILSFHILSFHKRMYGNLHCP